MPVWDRWWALARSPTTASHTVVDDAALGDERQGENWLAFRRTYSEQRFSPLTQIDDSNVGELGVDWFVDLPTDRDLSSTPLVVDGEPIALQHYIREQAAIALVQ